MKFFFFSCNYLNSSEVVLSTVCEINEKSPSTPSSCCAAVTGPPPSRPTNFKNRLVKQETRQEIEDYPELVDSCALKPLLGHGPGMEPSDPLLDDQYHQALIHRRRFGRQRGSISLDGRLYWIIHLIKLPYNSINLVYSLLPCDHMEILRFLNVSWLKKMKVMKFVFLAQNRCWLHLGSMRPSSRSSPTGHRPRRWIPLAKDVPTAMRTKSRGKKLLDSWTTASLSLLVGASSNNADSFTQTRAVGVTWHVGR